MFFYAFKGDGNPLYSPAFARGGLTGLFGAQIIQVLNTPSLAITIEGRDDSGTSWGTIGTFSAITAAGTYTATISALPQMLRYKFNVSGATAMAGVAMQLYAPQWQD